MSVNITVRGSSGSIQSTTVGLSFFAVSGYLTLGDLGAGALFVAGTSSDPGAIQDASGVWYKPDVSTGLARPQWFGAGITPGADDTVAMQSFLTSIRDGGSAEWSGIYNVKPGRLLLTPTPPGSENMLKAPHLRGVAKFNVLAPPSAVSSVSAVSGGTANVTVTSTLHGLTTGQWIYVFGSSSSEYNGLWQIRVTDPNTFKYFFVAAGAVPDGTINYVQDGPVFSAMNPPDGAGTRFYYNGHFEVEINDLTTAAATYRHSVAVRGLVNWRGDIKTINAQGSGLYYPYGAAGGDVSSPDFFECFFNYWKMYGANPVRYLVENADGGEPADTLDGAYLFGGLGIINNIGGGYTINNASIGGVLGGTTPQNPTSSTTFALGIDAPAASPYSAPPSRLSLVESIEIDSGIAGSGSNPDIGTNGLRIGASGNVYDFTVRRARFNVRPNALGNSSLMPKVLSIGKSSGSNCQRINIECEIQLNAGLTKSAVAGLIDFNNDASLADVFLNVLIVDQTGLGLNVLDLVTGVNVGAGIRIYANNRQMLDTRYRLWGNYFKGRRSVSGIMIQTSGSTPPGSGMAPLVFAAFWDPRNAWDASGYWTCPATGTYRIRLRCTYPVSTTPTTGNITVGSQIRQCIYNSTTGEIYDELYVAAAYSGATPASPSTGVHCITSQTDLAFISRGDKLYFCAAAPGATGTCYLTSVLDGNNDNAVEITEVLVP